MKKIGLTAERLSENGFIEYMASASEFEVDALEATIETPNDMKLTISEAQSKGIIHAVAKMIEANNAELLKQLKSAGVLPDQ